MKKISKSYQIPQNPYEYTLDEISKKLGISKERVRQLEQQAIRKMRLHGKQLKEYVYA
ncbi:MAG: sigma factor-like helix-turn-helix DNA-binding protein [Sulfurovum sp.]|nr:sigma factor-like helix-turn-helix DNA-binding protein [Sulfurovum sp.]